MSGDGSRVAWIGGVSSTPANCLVSSVACESVEGLFVLSGDQDPVGSPGIEGDPEIVPLVLGGLAIGSETLSSRSPIVRYSMSSSPTAQSEVAWGAVCRTASSAQSMCVVVDSNIPLWNGLPLVTGQVITSPIAVNPERFKGFEDIRVERVNGETVWIVIARSTRDRTWLLSSDGEALVTGQSLANTGIQLIGRPLAIDMNEHGDTAFVWPYRSNQVVRHGLFVNGDLVFTQGQSLSQSGGMPVVVRSLGTMQGIALSGRTSEGDVRVIAKCIVTMPAGDDVNAVAFFDVDVDGGNGCDSIDFNRNQVFPEDQDVIDFFNVLAGGPCPYPDPCDIDINNNDVYPEDQDVIDFFNLLAGGTCP